MRVLITGVYGFIGSHLAAHALDMGHDVVGIGRARSSAGEARLGPLGSRQNFHLYHADLATDISGVTERIDVVFHLAARTFVDHSIRDPATFVRNNYLASFNLMEDARRNFVPRFIQMSTDEVYGPIADGAHSEDAVMAPSNPYAATKGAVDLLLRAYHVTYGFPGIVARGANVYGKWQHPQKAIPTFARFALEGQPLPVFGDGLHRRAWVAVEDVCSALLVLAERGEMGRTYHIAGTSETTNLDLARLVLAHFDRPSDLLRFIPDRDARPGHDRRYALANSRLSALGWYPQYRLADHLPSVLDWLRENQWWLSC